MMIMKIIRGLVLDIVSIMTLLMICQTVVLLRDMRARAKLEFGFMIPDQRQSKHGTGGRTMNENKIQPSDIVLHKPSGEKWVVCGVNYQTGELIPCGYPFPSIGKIADCEIVEKRYHVDGQPLEHIRSLMDRGYMSLVDVRSAMFHGVI